MRRAAHVVASLVVLLAGAGGSLAAAPAAEREVLELASTMERLHPDLFASTPRPRFRAETTALARQASTLDRPALVVGLMRLVALAGPRNGHTAVYPYDRHARPLHVYPLRLYAFPTGLHVVAAPGRADLVGARLTAIEDVPIERITAVVRPLVPRDNASTVLDLLPEYVVTEEVLAGLGLTDGGTARLTFADGRSAVLEPVSASSFASIGSILAPLRRPAATQPLWLRFPERDQWLTRLDRGRTLYLGYHATTAQTWTVSQRLLRAARRPEVQRVVVDVRLNHGGDNTTYGALLDAMDRLSRTRSVMLLIGRATFSAAGNFAADVDALPRVRLLGEPTGGAPSQWGDSSAVELPAAGLTARVATTYQRFGRPGALTTRPHIAVRLTIEDFLAGRDPVLARALQAPRPN